MRVTVVCNCLAWRRPSMKGWRADWIWFGSKMSISASWTTRAWQMAKTKTIKSEERTADNIFNVQCLTGRWLETCQDPLFIWSLSYPLATVKMNEMQHLDAKQFDNRANCLLAHLKSVIKNASLSNKKMDHSELCFMTPRVNAPIIHSPSSIGYNFRILKLKRRSCWILFPSKFSDLDQLFGSDKFYYSKMTPDLTGHSKYQLGLLDLCTGYMAGQGIADKTTKFKSLSPSFYCYQG